METRLVRTKLAMLPVVAAVPVAVRAMIEKQGKTIRGLQDIDRSRESLAQQ